MQRKNHNATGFESVLSQTLSFLRNNSTNHFENSVRHKTKAMTVLNTKEMKLTLKLGTDMTFSSRKLFIETLPCGFLTQNTRKRFWQPEGITEGEEGVRNEGEGQVIYRENPSPTP
jgi:hypothetical protein